MLGIDEIKIQISDRQKENVRKQVCVFNDFLRAIP